MLLICDSTAILKWDKYWNLSSPLRSTPEQHKRFGGHPYSQSGERADKKKIKDDDGGQAIYDVIFTRGWINPGNAPVFLKNVENLANIVLIFTISKSVWSTCGSWGGGGEIYYVYVCCDYWWWHTACGTLNIVHKGHVWAKCLGPFTMTHLPNHENLAPIPVQFEKKLFLAQNLSLKQWDTDKQKKFSWITKSV